MSETHDPTPSAGAAEELTTEVRTFLIADVRDYTRFTQERGDEAAARLAAKFADIARDGVAARRGTVIELRGDEALGVFSSARQALRAAAELQARFAQEAAQEPNLPLRVGIGLDAGEAVQFEGGFRGGALNLAARLCSLAQPGEVLASETVVHLARRIEGLEYEDRGFVRLKGFADPIHAIRVVSAASSSQADPPLAQRPAESGQGAREQILPTGGFLGALPEGRLVAREVELDRIRGALRSVSEGAGRLIVLAGEPGVGKTRLAQEVTVQALERGFLVAAGSCYQQRQAAPYYPFLEVLATLYQMSPTFIQVAISQRWPYLGRLLPDRDIPVPAATADGLEDQERLFRAVSQFLMTVAETRPVTVMLDDLHWADEASIELLQYLARHTRAHRVLLLGSYRDVEIGPNHPLQATLLELNRQQLVEWIPVHRLESDGTAALMTATIGQAEMPPEFPELLHRHTEGNPFFVQEVLRELVERGDIYRQDSHWVGRPLTELAVPERVRAVIEQRLSRLSGSTQDILHEASVLGTRFTFDDLHRMSGRGEEAVEEGLEEAMAVGLIHSAGRDEYAFNHALTRQALYDDLLPRRRRRLHLAAGETIERAGRGTPAHASAYTRRAGATLVAPREEQRVGELAWHFLEADEPERAFPHAVLAGDRAEEIFAHREAERLYRAALEAIWESERSIEPRQAAEVLEKLGGVLQTMGRYDQALDTLEQAAEMYRTAEDLEGERRSVAHIGLVYSTQGRAGEGIARLQPLVESAEAQESPASAGLAMLYVALANLHHVGDAYPEGLEAAVRASRMARALGDDRILAQAEIRRGEGLAMLGRHDEGRQVLESIVPLAERSDLSTLIRVLGGVGGASLHAGRFRESRTYYQRALELAQQVGDPRGMAFLLASLAEAEFLLGDWAQAQSQMERAVELVRPLGLSHLTDYMHIFLGSLAAMRGEWQDASRLLDGVVARAEREKDSRTVLYGQLTLAERDLLQGDPRGVRDRLEPLPAQHNLMPMDLPTLLLRLAEAQIEMGETDAAEGLILDALASPGSGQYRPAFLEALRVRGLLRSSQGTWDEAERLFQSALSLARGMPYPYAEASILYDRGTMLSRMGQREESVQTLQEALEIFRRLGARPSLERTEEALQAARATDPREPAV